MDAAGTTALAEQKREWLDDLHALLREVETWAAAQKWPVARLPKEIAEDGDFESYQVDVLNVHCGQGLICVDPIGCFVMGAQGRVDLYAFPSLHRFMLLRKGRRWTIRTDSGVAWPKPWSRETFVELAVELARAA